MEFMGATNTLHGRVERVGGGVAQVALRGGGLARGRAMASLAPGAAVVPLVRAERLRLHAGARADGLEGRIVHVARMGFVTHYDMRLAGGQDVTAYRLDEAGEAGRPAAGMPVALDWEEADALVFPAAAEDAAGNGGPG
jgi:hypothetical protein